MPLDVFWMLLTQASAEFRVVTRKSMMHWTQHVSHYTDHATFLTEIERLCCDL